MSIEVATDAGVAEVVLDHAPVNAFSTALYLRLARAFASLPEDVRVVLVRSANPQVFSAGADIKEVEDILRNARFDLDEERHAAARELTHAVLACCQPSIAVLNGPALGAGAVLAACCDIRYASADATIGLPEINLVRCGGATQLKRHLAPGILRELYFTGQPLTAEEAARCGLINRVFPDAESLLEGARTTAGVIAAKSPLALRAAKEVLNVIESLPHDEAYPVEQSYARRLAKSADALEAAAAFVEKRRPVWSG